MKRSFPGFFRPTDAEFEALWSDATFVLDANVLLAIYGFSGETREALLELIGKLRARIWIPYQFAFEFHRNRPRAIFEQVNNYKSMVKALRGNLDQCRAKTRHPFVSSDHVETIEKLCAELVSGSDQHEKLLDKDSYFDRICEILDGCVGDRTSDEKLAKLYVAGRQRYERKTPPGFRDASKPEPDRFGDYVAWAQILEFASAKAKPVILVTNDEKDDWWRIYENRKLGPRPELVEEFLERTQQRFHMYSLDSFMGRAALKVDQKISVEIIEEVRERREAAGDDNRLESEKPADPNDAKATDTKPVVGAYDVELPKPEKPDDVLAPSDVEKSTA